MKKAAYIFVVIGLCLVINSLAHSIYDLWHKQDLLVSSQTQLQQELERNQKLKADYKYAQTQQFVEQQAHDKLFLVKPGEQQVLLSQSLEGGSKSNSNNNIPNWQQWLNIFF